MQLQCGLSDLSISVNDTVEEMVTAEHEKDNALSLSIRNRSVHNLPSRLASIVPTSASILPCRVSRTTPTSMVCASSTSSTSTMTNPPNKSTTQMGNSASQG